MAWTEFGPADPQTVTQWSPVAFHQAINKTYLRQLMGESEDAAIQSKRELNKGKGDNVRIDLITDLEADGTFGDAILEDNTEGLNLDQDTLKIDQLRHAVEARTMSQQRVLHNLRLNGMRKVTDWFAKRLDIMMHAHLAGTGGAGNANAVRAAVYNGFAGNGYLAADAAHAITTGATIVPNDLDACVERAQTTEPMIRPIMVEGQPYYICLMHPYSWTELRQTTLANGIIDVQKAAGVRGWDNPIFSGATGLWNNVFIYVSAYVPYTTATTLAHNIFLGAQAGAIAFGNPYDELDQETFGREHLFSWLEQRRDFGNRKMIGGGMIFGMKKVRFSGADFGTIALTTTDAVHS